MLRLRRLTNARVCTADVPFITPSAVILTLTSMMALSVISMYNVAPLVWYGQLQTWEGRGRGHASHCHHLTLGMLPPTLSPSHSGNATSHSVTISLWECYLPLCHHLTLGPPTLSPSHSGTSHSVTISLWECYLPLCHHLTLGMLPPTLSPSHSGTSHSVTISLWDLPLCHHLTLGMLPPTLSPSHSGTSHSVTIPLWECYLTLSHAYTTLHKHMPTLPSYASLHNHKCLFFSGVQCSTTPLQWSPTSSFCVVVDLPWCSSGRSASTTPV